MELAVIPLNAARLAKDLCASAITPLEWGLGSRLRYAYYRPQLRGCAGYFASHGGFCIAGAEYASIGKDCSFARGAYIAARNRIDIGNGVLVGPYSLLSDSVHRYEDPGVSISEQGCSKGSIRIGDDVWIGAHVVILDGAIIGNGSVVGALSLVKGRIPPNEVWGGVPARFIKKREKSD